MGGEFPFPLPGQAIAVNIGKNAIKIMYFNCLRCYHGIGRVGIRVAMVSGHGVCSGCPAYKDKLENFTCVSC